MHCYEYELMHLTVQAAFACLFDQATIDRLSIDEHLNREGIDSLEALFEAGAQNVARRMGARVLWTELRAA